VKKRLKINGVIMGGAALAIAFFPGFFLRAASGGAREGLLEVLGLACVLFGQLIRVSARGYKSEHSRDSRALIQGGPYQVVRNPMYLGIFLIGLGVVFMIFKWWAIIIFTSVFIVRYLLLIYKEEKKLYAMFPQDYPQYCAKIPRIFPAYSKLVKLDIAAYLPVKLSWFYREIGSISTLLLLILLVNSWKNIAQEGLWVYLRQLSWLLLTLILFAILINSLSKRTSKKNENSGS
jgi:protein-S-isoprenylcysteine O-methyltransferase Ste14